LLGLGGGQGITCTFSRVAGLELLVPTREPALCDGIGQKSHAPRQSFPLSAGRFPRGPNLSFLRGCDWISVLAHGRCLDASFLYIVMSR
jgi:hypothetical protein